jgi:hypothetical protein
MRGEKGKVQVTYHHKPLAEVINDLLIRGAVDKEKFPLSSSFGWENGE